jgi:hypothetical protein
MTEFIVTTLDGQKLRGHSENARLSTLVDQLNSRGYMELVVVSAEAGRSGQETATAFFKHGIISISEKSEAPAQTPQALPPLSG